MLLRYNLKLKSISYQKNKLNRNTKHVYQTVNVINKIIVTLVEGMSAAITILLNNHDFDTYSSFYNYA